MSSKTCFALALSLGLFGLTQNGPAQWVAYNDHYQGLASSNYGTFWNVFGTQSGAPGSAGFLRNITNGAQVPAWVSIINNGASGGTTSGKPDTNTPAFDIFNRYIDFGTGGPTNHAIQVTAAQSVLYTFTNLDLTRLYSFKATAIRGSDTYTNRWTLCELVNATSFANAHSPGVLTSGSSTNLLPTQVALNSGYNTAGQIVDWERIVPSSGGPGTNGTFTVRVTAYTNWIPAGYLGGGAYGANTHAYAFNAFRLEEQLATCTPAPVEIVMPPQGQSVIAGNSAGFSVIASGCPISYQWYKDASPIPGATNASFSLPSVALGDSGLYSVLLSNQFNSILSSNAPLVVSLAVIHLTNVWYYNQSNVDLGTAWKEVDYDDSSWPRGAGGLAVEDNAGIVPLIHTTLSLTNALGERTMTYYFRTHFTTTNDLSGLYFTFSNLIDDGAVFYLNGSEIYSTNMPTGPYCASTPATLSVQDAAWAGKYFASDRVYPGDNVLAVEVHQCNTNSSDIVFGVTLVATPLRGVVITEQPLSRITLAGSKTSFGVTAVGQAPLSYRWLKNGNALNDSGRFSGTRTAALIINGAQTGDQADYSVVVSNAFGVVTSAVATVTVGNVAAWGESTYGKINVPASLTNRRRCDERAF